MHVRKVRPWIKVMVVVVVVVLTASFLGTVLKAAIFSVFTILFFLPIVVAFVAGCVFTLRRRILGLFLLAAGCLTIYLCVTAAKQRPDFGTPQDIASSIAGAEYNFKLIWSIGWPVVFGAAALGTATEFLMRRNKSLHRKT